MYVRLPPTTPKSVSVIDVGRDAASYAYVSWILFGNCSVDTRPGCVVAENDEALSARYLGEAVPGVVVVRARALVAHRHAGTAAGAIIGVGDRAVGAGLGRDPVQPVGRPNDLCNALPRHAVALTELSERVVLPKVRIAASEPGYLFLDRQSPTRQAL